MSFAGTFTVIACPYGVIAESLTATGLTGVTVMLNVEVARLPSESATRYCTGVALPRNAGSGSNSIEPVGSTAYVPC